MCPRNSESDNKIDLYLSDKKGEKIQTWGMAGTAIVLTYVMHMHIQDNP